MVTHSEQVVLSTLRQRPHGGTSEEIAAWTGMSLVTASPRLKPLEVKGHVERAGKRANRSGKLATVWKAKRREGV